MTIIGREAAMVVSITVYAIAKIFVGLVDANEIAVYRCVVSQTDYAKPLWQPEQVQW